MSFRYLISSADVVAAVNAMTPSQYETIDGEVVIGDTVNRVPEALRRSGWKRVPKFDSADMAEMGLRVVEAQYIGGAKKTGKFVNVVVTR